MGNFGVVYPQWCWGSHPIPLVLRSLCKSNPTDPWTVILNLDPDNPWKKSYGPWEWWFGRGFSLVTMEHFWSIKTVAGLAEVLGPRGKSHFIQGPGEPSGNPMATNIESRRCFFFCCFGRARFFRRSISIQCWLQYFDMAIHVYIYIHV